MAQNFLSDIKLGDDIYIRLGDATNGDLQIYHDGANSVIADKGTGHLLLTAPSFRLRNDAQTEEIITADEDGAVKLYYDGSKKFETTSAGVTVTGDVTISANTPELLFADTDNNTDAKLLANNGNIGIFSDINQEYSDSIIYFNIDGTERARFDGSGYHFRPGADSTYDLGLNATRWRNVYADTLYGDGSNITGVTSDEALSLTLTGKNTTGSTLAAGSVVAFDPSASTPSGNEIPIKLADNNGTNSMPALGIIPNAITNDSDGDIVMFGRVSGFDTSSYSVGTELYVSDTAGAFTSTKPTGIKYIQKIGIVVRSDSSNGTVEVFGAGRTNDVPTPLYIDHANQRVGIGDTSPGYPLDTSGTIRSTSVSNSPGAGAGVELRYSSGAGSVLAYNRSSSNYLPIRIEGSTIDLREGGSSVLFVDDGKVGIGLTNPDEKLHVDGTSRFNGDMHFGTSTGGLIYKPLESSAHAERYFVMFDYTNDASYPFLTNRTPNGAVVIKTGTAAGGGENEHFRIKGGDGTVDAYFTNTNLGIGTNSPSALFHVAGSSPIIQTQDTDGTNQIGRMYQLSSDLVLSSRNNTSRGSFSFQSSNGTDTVERMVIDSSGNFFVGKTSDSVAIEGFQVMNDSYMANTVNNGTVAYFNRKTSDGDVIEIRKDNSAVGVIGTQSWGIGTASPSVQLEVKGSTYSLIRVNGANDAVAGIDFGDTDDVDIGRIRYDNSVDAMLFFTNNTEHARLDSSGNIQFNGTTSNTTVLSMNTSDGSDTKQLSLAGGGADSDGRGARLRLYGNEHASNAGQVDLSTGNIAGCDMFLRAKDTMQLYTANSERLRIASDGTITFNAYGAGYLKTDANGVISVDTDTIEDTLDSVTDRGSTTTNAISTGDITVDNKLNFTGTSYQISGGSSVGDMRFVAPRFRFYEDSISGAAKLEIDGGNATFAGDVTVGGNLTVSGTQTILNTQTVEVEDNIIQLNTTQGSPDTATATTSGISVYRGDGVTEASFIFDDGDDYWDLTHNLAVAGNGTFGGDVTVGALTSGQTAQLVINHEGGATPVAKFMSRTNRAQVQIGDNDTNGYLVAEGDVFSIGRTASASANNINIDASHNVGIGTTTPDTLLHLVKDSSNSQLTLQRTGSATGKYEIYTNTNSLFIYDRGQTALRAMIDSSGNFLVNKTTTGLADVGVEARAVGQLLATRDGDNVGYFNRKTSHGNVIQIRKDNSTVGVIGTQSWGIGTDTPENLLHIKAADGVTGVLKIEGGKNNSTSVGEINSQIDFGSNDGSVWSTGNVGGRIASVTETTNGAFTGMAFYTFRQGTSSPDSLSEKVRITNDGKVGIGATSPYKKLEVTGDIQLDATDANIWIKSGAAGTNGFINWTFNSDSTVYNKVGIDYDTRATTGFHIDAGYPITIDATTRTNFAISGSDKGAWDSTGLGIGTTSPVTNLDSVKDGTQLRLKKADGTDDDWRFYSWTSGLNIFPQTASTIFFGRDGATTDVNVWNGDFIVDTNTLFVDASVNSVGVGTTNPDEKFHVEFTNTDTSFSGGSGGAWGSEGIRIENTSSTADTMAMLHLRSGDADIHIAGIRKGTNDSDLGFFFEGTQKVLFENDGSATFSGTITLAGSSNEIIKSDGSVRIDIDNNNDQTDRIFIVSKHNSATELFRVNESGNGIFAGSVYATDLVDADNTDYYVDPDWTSVMADIDLDGFIAHNGYTTTKFGFSNNHEIKFNTNGSEALKLDSNQVATFGGQVNVNDDSNPSGTSGSLIVEGRRDGTANLLTLRAKDASAPTVALPSGQGGIIRWQGFDGTDFAQMGAIAVVADGQDVADSDAPSRMVFYTTADGSETLTTALTLDKSQDATFENNAIIKGDLAVNHTANTASAPLYIGGNVSRGSWNDGIVIDEDDGWAATIYKRSNAPKMFTGLYSGNDNYIWMATPYDNTGTSITAPRTDMVLEARPSTDDLQIYLDTHFGGRIGVGTDSPEFALHLADNVNSGGVNSGVMLEMRSSTATDPAGMRFVSQTGGTTNYMQNLYDGANLKWKHWSGSAYVDKITFSNTGNATFAGYVDAVNFKINGAQGTDGQVLTSTGSGVAWEDAAGATIDGSGTANDVVMWSDSDTLTDAPIAISGNNATFGGNITISKSVGDAVLTVEADSDNDNENDNPRIELKQDSGIIYGHFGINGDANATFTGAGANSAYIRAAGGLDIATDGSTKALTIDNSQNAIFSGRVKGTKFTSVENSTDGGFSSTRDYLLAGTGDRGGAVIINDVSGARHALIAGGYDLTFAKEKDDGAGTVTHDTWMRANAADAASNVSSIDFLKESIFAGDVTVSGNLTVTGTSTSVNVEDLNVEQGEITLNYAASSDTSSSADGAGIRIQDAVDASNDATILWDQTNSEFDFSHGANFAGDINIGGNKLKGTSSASNFLDFDDDSTTHNPDTNVTTLASVSGIALATNLNDGGGGNFTVSTGSTGTELLKITTSGNATFSGNVDVDGAGLNVGSANEVQIVSSGSSLFPSIKLNNNGYIGSASETDAMQFLTNGNIVVKRSLTVEEGSINNVVQYTKAYSSLDTTGQAVAGLGTSSNGASAMFVFETAGGGEGGYQKIVYNCINVSGTWAVYKDIDEGGNRFDITGSGGTTVTFTFKGRTANQSYTPRVVIKALGGSAINTSYI